MGHSNDACRFLEGMALIDGDDLPVFSESDVPAEGEGTLEPLMAMMFDGKEEEGMVWPRLGPWLVTTCIRHDRPEHL